MLENPSWYFRDLKTRNVVVMLSRKAVRIVSMVSGKDMANVVEVKSGKTHCVDTQELYEPSGV
jgi:hypothetical protein